MQPAYPSEWKISMEVDGKLICSSHRRGILLSEHDMMEATCMTTRTCKAQLLTIPNLLSLLRLTMIPAFVSLYIRGESGACALLLVLSGATDLLDGWIARRFNAVSDVGKVLDPAADKLTLAAALGMLISTHKVLLIPMILLVVKELAMGLSGAVAVVRTNSVPSARWHGKATTALMYMTMFVHIIWQDIPSVASNTMAVACTLMMLFSMTLYISDNIRRIKCGRGGSTDDKQAA